MGHVLACVGVAETQPVVARRQQVKWRTVHRKSPHGHHVARNDTLRQHRVAGRVRVAM